MKKILIKVCVFLVIALVINILDLLLKSNFIGPFLFENIIILLIPLMAINTATGSLVVSKLQDLQEKYNVEFEKTFDEIRMSQLEQIFLIAISLLLSILNKSQVVISLFNENSTLREFIFNLFITVVLVYAIDILRDTGRTTFDIIKKHQNKKS